MGVSDFSLAQGGTFVSYIMARTNMSWFMSDSWNALSVNVVLCLMVDVYRVHQ